MKKFNEWLTAKNITPEQFAEKDANEQAGLYNEYNDTFRAKLNELEANGATKDELSTLKSELARVKDEQFDTLKNALKEQGVELKKLKEAQRSSITNTKSLKESLMERKEDLAKVKDGDRTIRVKVAGNMSIAGNVTGQVPQAQRLPGMDAVASRQVRLLDIVSPASASSNLIEWVYQANKDGAAGQTAENTAKNQIDFDLAVGSQKVEKTTAYIKVTTEMLDDIDFIESEIRNELMRELTKAVEAGVYEGDGISPNLNGIRTVASAFAAGSFAASVDNANIVDVLAVAANQIQIAEQPMPNYILMHPSDVTSLKLEKLSATDKRYIDRLQMIAGTLLMDGIPIIPTTLVTQDEYLIGHFEFAQLFEKGGIQVEIGLDADDFTNNRRTIIAEWRGAMVVKNNKRSAFVAGTFTTDKAALETI